jgi:Fe-S-cluster-containing dehydrogenase component/DMSO reductase anchor subunit
MYTARNGSAVSLPLVNECLREQRQITAVERFAQRHGQHKADVSDGSNRLHASTGADRIYRDLIPLGAPQPGQQYAFQVDLDVCTGCQACVTACHRMNGLDVAEAETWRSVGVLQGHVAADPVQMTVTAACHHCIDPACMTGCPVGAYEKDALTGIVRHLDDQCIGCQYCMLTCPYEVPQFNERLGIVRKCDMCAGRLEAREEPACVQACPNEAISIQLVEKATVLQAAYAGAFLPGAPSSAITGPSTQYLSKIALEGDILPADYYEVRPSKGHSPLAVMLVLTQWSVGALLLDVVLTMFAPSSWPLGVRAPHVMSAALIGALALAASTLHLGRPLYAWRALIGLRTSWLSREVLMFGLFMPIAIIDGAATGWAALRNGAASPLPRWLMAGGGSALACAFGAAGIFCSVMIYAITRKRWWSGARTAFRFTGTALILGASTALVDMLLYGAPSAASERAVRWLAIAVSAVGLVKLVWETRVIARRHDTDLNELKRTAMLLQGEMRRVWLGRLGLGFIGALLIPLAIGIASFVIASLGERLGRLPTALSLLGLSCAAAGEVVERSLFFRAVSGPRMPGKSGG